MSAPMSDPTHPEIPDSPQVDPSDARIQVAFDAGFRAGLREHNGSIMARACSCVCHEDGEALQSRLTAALEVVRVERARHFPETHNVTGRPFTVCVVCSDVQDAPWPCDPAQAMDKVLEEPK
jgi:hypothetical protein